MRKSNARQRRKQNEDGSAKKPHPAFSKSRSNATSRNWIVVGLAVVGLSVTAGVLFYLFIWPTIVSPVYFDLHTAPEFIGALAPNDKLTKGEILLEGQLLGPESLTQRNGLLYTGTADGRVLEINTRSLAVHEITRLGRPPCGGAQNENTCGRPLGIRFDKHENLIVADAYLGVFSIDTKTGKSDQLFSSSSPVDGLPPIFLNDIDVADDGTIYVTDSSARFQRRQFLEAILDGKPDGRLLMLNPSSKSSSVLIDGLAFPNGVQLSPDQSYVLVAEGGRCRIWRYFLKGSRKGQKEIFADNLPGFVDNLRPSSDGGYWVGLAVTRTGLSLLDLTASRPWLRTLMYKSMPTEMLVRWSPAYGLVVKLDADGHIVESLHDPTGRTVGAVSEVLELDGSLYLGSFNAQHIVRIKY